MGLEKDRLFFNSKKVVDIKTSINRYQSGSETDKWK